MLRKLRARLGAELREVGENMRRWHALNAAAEGGAFWSEGVKARKHVLIEAIKQLDRAAANEAMREAVERPVGDADAVALALVPLDDDGNSVLHYCARHDATVACDAIVFFGARWSRRGVRARPLWLCTPPWRGAHARCAMSVRGPAGRASLAVDPYVLRVLVVFVVLAAEVFL